MIPQYYVYETTGQFTAIWDALYGSAIIGSLVMIWFVFFPPVFYQRWVTSRAGLGNADKGSERNAG